MAHGDLDFGLLLEIMKKLGEMRDIYPDFPCTRDLVDLIPAEQRHTDNRKNTVVLDRYLKFLQQKGYLELGTPVMVDLNRTIRLTAAGETFVQPELAEIDTPSILPQVVKSIESQILTYPEEARNGFLFNLREAIARNAPDVAAKLLVEVLPKLLLQGV